MTKSWREVRQELIDVEKEYREKIYSLRRELNPPINGRYSKCLPPLCDDHPIYTEKSDKIRDILSQEYTVEIVPNCKTSCPVKGCTYYSMNEEDRFCQAARYEIMCKHLRECHHTTFEKLEQIDTCDHNHPTSEYTVMIPGTCSHIGAEYDIFQVCTGCGKIMSRREDWL